MTEIILLAIVLLFSVYNGFRFDPQWFVCAGVAAAALLWHALVFDRKP